jgi:hypothetical protein
MPRFYATVTLWAALSLIVPSALVALQIALLSVTLEPIRAAEYGTADEAKAMLEKAVASSQRRQIEVPDVLSHVCPECGPNMHGGREKRG